MWREIYGNDHPRNMCEKQHGVWSAQKPCAMRADTSIDFPSLTKAFSTCSKRLLFEQLYYRKFTDTCGCNPGLAFCAQLAPLLARIKSSVTIRTIYRLFIGISLALGCPLC